MATYRHWPGNCGETQTMSHTVESCPLTKLNWRLIPATLCRWRTCFLADQLWSMTRIRERKEMVENQRFSPAIFSLVWSPHNWGSPGTQGVIVDVQKLDSLRYTRRWKQHNSTVISFESIAVCDRRTRFAPIAKSRSRWAQQKRKIQI